MSYILDTPFASKSVFFRSSLYTTNNSNNKDDLIFELSEPIFCDENLDLLISLESFQFTNSFYTINKYNQYLYYLIDNSNNLNIVKIPMGIYNINSLIVQLSLLMPTFIISVDNVLTYKISISNSLKFKFVSIDNQFNNIYEMLGINDYGTNTYEYNILAPYLYNLISVQVLHVCIPNLDLQNIHVRNTKKYNILASIHITTTFGETQTYLNTNNFKFKINDPSITFLNIVILNQDMQVVEFNNIDWFINLSFQHIVKKSVILNDSLNQYINNKQISDADKIDDNIEDPEIEAVKYLKETEINNIIKDMENKYLI